MSSRPGYPFADTEVTKFISERIEALSGKKTQREIAAEIGYDKPNIVSMFKRGEMKVPLDKVKVIANALDADPKHLFRLVMNAYWPDLEELVNDLLGDIVTENEAKILHKIRELTCNKDPEFTPELAERLEAAFRMV